ncbi:MAG: barstar family protein [Anaerococcus sp.]
MVVLEGSKFLDKETTFEYLNKELNLDYNVTNLDALYDCLSMISEDIEIVNYRDIVANLGDYGKSLIEVFLESSLNEDINLNLLTSGD